MTQNEVLVTESTPAINENVEISEIPSRPFRLTMELPLFLSMLSITLSVGSMPYTTSIMRSANRLLLTAFSCDPNQFRKQSQFLLVRFIGTAISNIILYRTCYVALGHSKDECAGFLSLDKTNQTQLLENEVQKYATFVSTVRSVIEALAPAILSCLLGVWSDTHGRKPLVVWPLLGIALTGILQVVYSMMGDLGPWWYMITSIPYSLTGGFTVMFTGAFCYISDVSSTEKRSIRMTIMEAAVSLGSVLGGIISPYVLRAVGSVYLLLISAALSVVAYVYTNIWIRESLTGAISGSLSSVLDFLLIKEMIRECFKWRPNKGRGQVLLLTLANSLTVFIMYGIFSLEYLYSREKLHWTLPDYTRFSATHTTVSFFGGFFGVIVVQRLFRISDLAFANIAFVSAAIEFSAKAMATETWHMYLGSVLSMFRGLSSPLIRSLLTKILPLTDIAKVFALMSAIEGICPLISPVMYNSLYEATISAFPAAIYVLCIAVTAISITCTGFVQYYRWSVTSPYQRLGES